MTVDIIISCVMIVWLLIAVIQFFLAFGTAYRCTKQRRDDGVGLFIHLVAFTLAAIVPFLGLHYYVRYLQTKIIIKQQAQPQPTVVKIIEPASAQSPNPISQQTQQSVTQGMNQVAQNANSNNSK